MLHQILWSPVVVVAVNSSLLSGRSPNRKAQAKWNSQTQFWRSFPQTISLDLLGVAWAVCTSSAVRCLTFQSFACFVCRWGGREGVNPLLFPLIWCWCLTWREASLVYWCPDLIAVVSGDVCVRVGYGALPWAKSFSHGLPNCFGCVFGPFWPVISIELTNLSVLAPGLISMPNLDYSKCRKLGIWPKSC